MRLSKDFKGTGLLRTPQIRVARSRRRPADVQVPELPEHLRELADRSYELKLPPHLQEELDTLRAQRDAAAARALAEKAGEQ